MYFTCAYIACLRITFLRLCKMNLVREASVKTRYYWITGYKKKINICSSNLKIHIWKQKFQTMDRSVCCSSHFDSSWMSPRWSHSIFNLVSPTWLLKTHPSRCVRQQLVPFRRCVIFHHRDVPVFAQPLTSWRTFGLFPVWGNDEQNHCEYHGQVFK